MNQLVGTDPQQFTQLAPATTWRFDPATALRPQRVLFLNLNALGWQTYARQLEHHAARRDDLHAWHLNLHTPLWMKLACRKFGSIKQHPVHPVRCWEWIVSRWITSGRLPLQQFDRVHVSPHTAAWAIAKLPAHQRTKLSVTIDVTDPLNDRELEPGSACEVALQAERDIFKAADLIACFSSWAVESLRSDFHVPLDKIAVTLPSIDRTEPSTTLKPAASPSNLPRILFVGNDHIRKGGPRLLSWHQELWSHRAELHILSEDAQPLTGTRNVFWHGRVPHDKVLGEHFPGAAMLVLPTLRDMSSWVSVEAQTCGVPVIASRIGGIPDLIDHERTGFLVAPHDNAGFITAISQLLDDPQLRLRMAHNAAEMASVRFDAVRVFDSLMDRMLRA